MKNRIKVYPIGKIENENSKTVLRLKPGYREGLKGLAGFSHVQILWWMDGCDDLESRNILVEKRPYVHGPEEIGVFALRSPERPTLLQYPVRESPVWTWSQARWSWII